MKTERKPRRRPQTRIMKKRKRRDAILLALLSLAIILSACFTYTFLSQPRNPAINPAYSQLEAAIVDQLSLTAPNQTFIQTATSTLKQAGYTVDYYPGENVTVEFYRNLATLGYRIVVLRVHSTATGAQGTRSPVTLFTSERFDSTKYVSEQLVDQLSWVSFSEEEKDKGIMYFGASPYFFAQCMKGRFQNTIIIMMGCEGLNNSSLAKAFIEKGAKAYISWDKPVLASYTDTATACLLKHLVTDKQTIEQALYNTMIEAGLDPAHKSMLGYYPAEVGEQTIENINSGL